MDKKYFKFVLNDSQTVYLNESQLKKYYPNLEVSPAALENFALGDADVKLLASNNTKPVLRKIQVSSPSLQQNSTPQASPLLSESANLVELETSPSTLVAGTKLLKTEGVTSNLNFGTAMTSEIPGGMVTSIQGNQEAAFKENLSRKGTDRGSSKSVVIASSRNGGNSRSVLGSMNIGEEDRLEVPYITNLYIITTDGVKRGLTCPEKIELQKIPSLMRQFLDQIGFRDSGKMEAVVGNPKSLIPVIKRLNMTSDMTGDSTGPEIESDSTEEKSPVRISVDEVLTVCYFCRHMLSSQETRCPKCHKKVPGEVKENITERFNNSNGSRSTKSLRISHRERLEEQKKKKAQKKSQELVCLSLISSDEEDDESVPKSVRSLESINSSILAKEPIITDKTESPFLRDSVPASSMIGGGIVDYSDVLDSPDVESAQVHCRSVRFGSYKANALGKVKITHFGFKITVPPVNGPEDVVTVTISRHDIVKVLAHFGRQTPVIFYYTTSRAGAKVRNALKMSLKPEAVYFDPTSTVEMHRRITLFPDKIPTETRLFLKSIYNHQMVLEELTSEEADRILVRAKPKEVLVAPEKDPLVPPSAAVRSHPIQRIMTYPPPPSKGGIPINTEDYACLDEDQFLNDVIIDFYLKWYVANKLKPEDQKRTYVFSSFFYKRLTTSAGKHAEDTKLSPAERRHKRVKSWTKSVDLFSKDFVIIPINENSHWFLGIICFPGLTEAVRMSDNTPVSNPSRRLAKDDSMSGKVGSSVTITMVPAEKQPAPPTINLEGEDEEKDEAEGDDDDLEPNTSDEESPIPSGYEDGELLDDITPPPIKIRSRAKQVETDQEPIKQPCILIFDSLAGALSSRSRVCATLREYLQVEYNSKNKGGKPREINKFNFRAAIPKVPQQTNFTDCGLYVLQYVEAFFQNPISDYRMPIKELKEWFNTDIVGRKRYQIQQLLHQLMAEQNVDMSVIKLPKLNLRPEGPYSEEEEELDMYDEDMGEEEEDDEEEEEEMGEEEEDEDGELASMMPPASSLPAPVPPPTITPILPSPSVSLTQIPPVAVVSSTNSAIVAPLPSPVPPPTASTAVLVVSSSSSVTVTATQATQSLATPQQPPPPPSPQTSNVISTDNLRATLFSRGLLTKTSSASSQIGSAAPSSPTSTTNMPSVTVSRPIPPQFTKGEVTVKRKVNTVSLKDVRSPRLSSTSEVEVKKKRME